MARKVAIALVVILLTAGCLTQPDVQEKEPPPEVPNERLGNEPGEGMYRVIDEEAGVVCWYMDDGGENGQTMDCMPMNETDL